MPLDPYFTSAVKFKRKVCGKLSTNELQQIHGRTTRINRMHKAPERKWDVKEERSIQ